MRSRLNRKTIGLVAISAGTAVAVLLILGKYYVDTGRTRSPTQHRVVVQVLNWANLKPVASIPIQVSRKDHLPDESIVAIRETDGLGRVLFMLPTGHYTFQVARGVDWTGSVDVRLNTDIQVELTVLAVSR